MNHTITDTGWNRHIRNGNRQTNVRHLCIRLQADCNTSRGHCRRTSSAPTSHPMLRSVSFLLLRTDDDSSVAAFSPSFHTGVPIDPLFSPPLKYYTLVTEIVPAMFLKLKEANDLLVSKFCAWCSDCMKKAVRLGSINTTYGDHLRLCRPCSLSFLVTSLSFFLFFFFTTGLNVFCGFCFLPVCCLAANLLER